MSSYRKETNDLCEALRKQGFTVEIVKNGHYKATAPDGQSCQFARSPSRATSVRNAVTRLKRIGYEPVKK